MAVSTRITHLHRAEAWAFDAAMGHFAGMGIDKASASGAAWARALGPLTPAHQVALKNLALAYPGESDGWRRDAAMAMWAEIGRWAAEFPHLKEISCAPGNGRVTLIGAEHFAAVRDSGKGAVFFSGHFANFEIMMIAIVQSGVRCMMTYRPLNNPIIDSRVLGVRGGYGVDFPAAKGIEGGVGLLRALLRGDSVAVLNDQKYNEGLAAPLFGHDAMTADGPARMALRFGAPLVPLCITRVGDSVNFVVEAFAPMRVDTALPAEQAIRATVLAINQWVEARVRAAPAQWWWMHNRWPKAAWANAGIA